MRERASERGRAAPAEKLKHSARGAAESERRSTHAHKQSKSRTNEPKLWNHDEQSTQKKKEPRNCRDAEEENKNKIETNKGTTRKNGKGRERGRNAESQKMKRCTETRRSGHTHKYKKIQTHTHTLQKQRQKESHTNTNTHNARGSAHSEQQTNKGITQRKTKPTKKRRTLSRRE